MRPSRFFLAVLAITSGAHSTACTSNADVTGAPADGAAGDALGDAAAPTPPAPPTPPSESDAGTPTEDATTPTPDPPTLVDVNDVSVLFPYSLATGKLSPDVPLDAFIARDVFSQVLGEAASHNLADSDQINFSVYENWRIVGFRFDPCAPSLAMALGQTPPDLVGVVPGCLVELRLVAQPVTLRGPNAPPFEVGPGTAPISGFPTQVKSPQDYGLHLVYDLGVYQGSADGAQLKTSFGACQPASICEPLVRGLIEIKASSAAAGVDTNGALLGVHPGLQAEAASGHSDVSAAVAAYLTKFLAPQRLTRATFFGVPSRDFSPWTFFGGRIEAPDGGSPKFVDVPLVGFASAIPSQTIPRFDQMPTNPVSLTAIANEPSSARSSGIEGLFELDDPARRHIFNTDCASCHAANLVSDQSGTKVSAMTDLSKSRFVPPRGVSGYITTEVFNTTDWFLHNFGYFGPVPRVAERTSNETAMVADVVNRISAGGEHVNPGLDCGSDRATLDAIYFCQRTNRVPESARKACFAPCKITGANAHRMGNGYAQWPAALRPIQ